MDPQGDESYVWMEKKMFSVLFQREVRVAENISNL